MYLRSWIRRAGSLMLGLMWLAVALGQQPAEPLPGAADTQTIKGVQLKGKAPVARETLAVQLPKPVEATLKNGLHIVLIEDHKLPTFVLQLVFPYGSIFDGAGKEGLAAATAQQLREGTQTYTGKEIAQKLDTLGGTLFANASMTTTTLTASGLIENLDSILKVYADVVRNPAFPATELAKFKTRLISQIQYQRSSSGFAAQERFAKAVYGDFPAGMPVPPEASIASLERDDLAQFHHTYYCPNCATVLAAGDITLPQLMSKLQRVFGDWQEKSAPPIALPPVKNPDAPHVYVINRPGSVQTSLILGALGIEGDNPDRFAIAVMNQVLGGGPASRLFTNLREDKGYTYGAYSSASSYRYPGAVAASAEVRTEVTAGAMQEFAYELRRIRTEPASAVEIADAKRAIIGSFALSLERPQSFLANIYAQKVYGFAPDYWDRYPANIAAVTAQDIQRVAAKYYAAQRLQIVAVGDASKIAPVMEKYGTVQ